MKLQKEIKESRNKLNEDLIKLDRSIKKNKKKWIKENIICLAAHSAILGNQLGFEKPSEVLDKADKLIDEWCQKTIKKRKFMEVKDLYKEWASYYDNDPNLVIFLEEKAIKDFLPNVKNKKILDFGCGTGRYAIPLAKKGANVTAIDFTQKMLIKAKQKAKKSKAKIHFSKQDITKYQTEERFDLIISMLVLDHVKDLKEIVKVIRNASKLGTEVIISNIPPEIIRKNVDIKTGKGQGYIVEGKETNQFYHPLEEYVTLFREQGFLLTKIKNLIYEKKYQNIKKFEKFAGIKNKSIGILMKFERMK